MGETDMQPAPTLFRSFYPTCGALKRTSGVFRNSVVILGWGSSPVRFWAPTSTIHIESRSSRLQRSLRRNGVPALVRPTRTNVRGDLVVTGKLTPRSPSTTFGEHIKIETLQGLPGHRIEVKVSPKSTASPRWVDTGGTVAGFTTDAFDQVVCAIGQKRHHKESQSWAALVRSLILEARRYKEHLIRDADGRAVGLKNRTGTLRILGAAALNHPYLERVWSESESPSYSYYRSLVEQARVPVGIALAANAVAAANNFVLSERPPNINMCSLAELNSALGWLIPDFAVTAFATRGIRTIPHTEQELYGAYRRFWSFFY